MSVAKPCAIPGSGRSHARSRGRALAAACAALSIALGSLTAGCSGGGSGGGGSTAIPPVAPSGLSYPAPGPLVVGVPIASLSPTLATGSADQYDVSPPLPAGLALDPVTGVIDGTPAASAPLSTYTITATNSAGSSAFGLDLEVVDPPALPVAGFVVDASAAAEGAGSAVAEVSLSSSSAADVTIAVLVSGTAAAGSDFTPPAALLVIPAGMTSASIVVAIGDDGTDEPDETVILELDLPSGALLGAATIHTLTIADDDPLPQARFATSALALPETPGTTAIEVLLDRPSSSPVDLAVALAGSAQPGSDYLLAPTSLTLPPGATSASLALELLGDSLYEGDETIQITLVPGAGAIAGTPDSLAVSIGDDDSIPVAELSGGGSATEGSGPIALTVSLSTASAIDAVISFALGGTAAAGADYTATASPVTIPAGTLSASILIEAQVDGAIEGPETAEVTLSAATGAVLGAAILATVTIDDPAVALPVLTLAGGGSIVEGAGIINLVATLSAISATPVEVPFGLTGSATAGADFAPPANPVTIPAGSLSAPITIEPVDDGLVEGPESVTVTLLSPTGATLGAPIAATVTIIDVAPPPEVTISGGGSILESGAPLDLVVTLSASAPAEVQVDFSLGGTATAGTDYAATPSRVTIPAGTTSAEITIDPSPDAAVEGPETIVVTLTGATGATLGAAVVAAVTIDEAQLPTITLGGGGVSGLEGAGPMFLTATLSAPSSVGVQVFFAYTGTAIRNADYLSTPSPQSIPAGSLTASIAIDPLGDLFAEADETVTVTLTSAIGAVLGATVAQTVTIEDDAAITVPPNGLTYAEPSAVYAVGAAIAPNLPTLATGTATSWGISPPLPAGLVLDPATGAITGAPEEIQLATTYLVLAANSLGSTSASISIEIRAAFAFAMSSPTVPYSPATGDAVFAVSLTVQEDLGSSPAAYHEVQSLSAGIGFDAQVLEVLDVTEGNALSFLNGGTGPEVFLATPHAGGLTIAILFSFSQAATITAPAPAEWGFITFRTVPGYLTGDVDGETLLLPWVGNLGSPPVPCALSYESLFFHPPALLPGTVTFVP